MSHTLAALDVETANPDFASICQIGVVFSNDGRVVSTWQSLIDSEDCFDLCNVAIHDITPKDVAGSRSSLKSCFGLAR